MEVASTGTSKRARCLGLLGGLLLGSRLLGALVLLGGILLGRSSLLLALVLLGSLLLGLGLGRVLREWTIAKSVCFAKGASAERVSSPS